MSRSIISIAAGRIPAATIAETASPASSVESEGGEQRRHGLGPAQDAQRDLGHDPERALGADEHAEQVGAVRLERLAAELDELAVGQHDRRRPRRG